VPAAPVSPAKFAEVVAVLVDHIGSIVHGKRDVVQLAVLALCAEGHVLIEDVPGVGKTSLARALAQSIGGDWSRVQFTPDLLPADVVGSAVFLRDSAQFEFRSGPVFTNVLLADEVNRATPKTQSALLEAMEERQVTADGATHPLPRPFVVLATQNPLDHEGTHPLPESQLDRFLVRLSMGYPDREAELRILTQQGAASSAAVLPPIMDVRDVMRLVATVLTIRVEPAVRGYLVDLATQSRRQPGVRIGMSPRATLALQRLAQAHAAADGRDFLVPDDVIAVAPACLGHRLGGNSPAQGAEIVGALLATVTPPRAQLS
jgi:MoxR-like ATPase